MAGCKITTATAATATAPAVVRAAMKRRRDRAAEIPTARDVIAHDIVDLEVVP